MKRFIALINFTDQGRTKIQDSPKRAARFVEDAASFGVTINAQYWTTGSYDGLISFDAPDEESAAALMIKLTAAGNVTTQTLQAFNHDEVASILAKAAS